MNKEDIDFVVKFARCKRKMAIRVMTFVGDPIDTIFIILLFYD